MLKVHCLALYPNAGHAEPKQAMFCLDYGFLGAPISHRETIKHFILLRIRG